VWDNVQQRIIYADNAAVAVRFLETGNADAGIVPLSLAKAAGLAYKPVDAALYDRLQQTIIAVPNGKQAGAAQEFLTFLEGPQGWGVLDNYGYILPGAE
jgi:molybdate transport system substrate-binding protein